MATGFHIFGEAPDVLGEYPDSYKTGSGGADTELDVVEFLDFENDRAIAFNGDSGLDWHLLNDAELSLDDAEDDWEVLIRFQGSETSSSVNVVFGLRVQAAAATAYGFRYQHGSVSSSGLSIFVDKFGAGSFDRLATYNTGLVQSDTNNEDMYLRVRCQANGANTDLKLRWWLASGSEPGTWSLEHTDTGTAIAAGLPGLAFRSNETNNIHLDWITWGTNGDAAPDDPAAGGGGATGTIGQAVHHVVAALAGQVVPIGVLGANVHHASAAAQGLIPITSALSADVHHVEAEAAGVGANTGQLAADTHHVAAAAAGVTGVTGVATPEVHHVSGAISATQVVSGTVAGDIHHTQTAIIGTAPTTGLLAASVHHVFALFDKVTRFIRLRLRFMSKRQRGQRGFTRK